MTNPVLRLLVQSVLAAVLIGSGAGCQLLMGVVLLLDGPPREDADFKTHTGRKMTEKGKKVIVLCSAPERARGSFTSLDLDVITEVSRRMRAHGIELVDPSEVATWIDDNGGEVTEDDLPKIGRKFDATYIVHINIKDFSYKNDNSPGLYQGKSNGSVYVLAAESGKKSGTNGPFKLVYSKPFSSTYPIHQPASTGQVTESGFRKQYLDRISEELARRFYDHRPGEEF